MPKNNYDVFNFCFHFTGYQTILQRLCSTSTVSASSLKGEDNKGKNKSAGDLGPDFDLGFISHAECDTSLNHDVIRQVTLTFLIHGFMR